jgi:hypothetical protein
LKERARLIDVLQLRDVAVLLTSLIGGESATDNTTMCSDTEADRRADAELAAVSYQLDTAQYCIWQHGVSRWMRMRFRERSLILDPVSSFVIVKKQGNM